MIIHPDVRAQGMSVNLAMGLWIVDQVYTEMGYRMVWRHCKEGKHRDNSRHYDGDGADIRTWDVDAEEIVFRSKKRLGSEYHIILEDKGKPNEHIHISYWPKGIDLG